MTKNEIDSMTDEQVTEALERDAAIARRDAIGRIYGFVGSYGTTNPADTYEGTDIGVDDVREDYPGQRIVGRECSTFNN